MAKKKKSAATPALQVLTQSGVAFGVHEFDPGHDHFGDHAAAQLAAEGIEAGQIFKTLVIREHGTTGNRGLAVACVPVTGSLSLKKAARALGWSAKADMADQQDAQRSSGYIAGGISPVGQKNPLPTVIDSSANNYGRICVSGGRRGLDIELSPQDLAAVTGAVTADIAAD
ncbi:Cys-tRNA(Pro) deacylase [Corynebacterium mendelii]|uniref:Cys-tRNA(Pro)/Cys-tRNA(Cys) deacylase n=1 Tax=Corynebacterium mendelii TaxID=2765362 RepID=A0A939E0J9_9CORY|nr:Cys-tRNA(Pro) deacylase [Corynebacterium mendelii]MBN9644458.1 Cys-tRNA(Pro) deacylase [Corynebacterium mendelii]